MGLTEIALGLERAGVELSALPRPPGGFWCVGEGGGTGEGSPASPHLLHVGNSPCLCTGEGKGCLLCG